MRLGNRDYLHIQDPGSTFLRVADEPSACCMPCDRPIDDGDLYVEHWGAPYHLECAIQQGWIECRPLCSCAHCGMFFWPGQPHDTCRAASAGIIPLLFS